MPLLSEAATTSANVREHDRNDDLGQCRGSGDAVVVDRRQDDHCSDRDRPLPASWRNVRGEGQRHRCATGDLPDNESPAGEKAPPRPQPLPTVDVGSARGRILGGQLSRRRGVAVRHERGYGKTDQQTRAGNAGGGGEGGEHPGAEHRAQPDDHRVERAETSRQSRLGHDSMQPHTGVPNPENLTPGESSAFGLGVAPGLQAPLE